MKYYSTNRKSPAVNFREATINGQAPDKGLYFPEEVPVIDRELIEHIDQFTNEEIAFRVISPFVDGEIPPNKLEEIVRETINFPIPLVSVTDRAAALELYHGPTLAFKDVGARFMSRCLGHFVGKTDQKVTVLVATSGDTGGAVASGFHGVDGIEVVILYPSGKVSPVQEKQLTTLGDNIHALEIAGNFDDCQRLVKEAFADPTIKEKKFLTSANSINIARWLPQQFYYFFAFKQWPDKDNPPVLSVPSGNFGNICAGLLAYKSGLTSRHFIAACNANDIVSEYLETGRLKPKAAIATISNAMDVGNPSNFVRVLEVFRHRFPELKTMLSSYAITDEETRTTIAEVHRKFGYTLDPHGAVGFLALSRYLQDTPGTKGIFLETAHPVKFPATVEEMTGEKISIPSSVQGILGAEKSSIKMLADYSSLRNFLLD